MNIDPAADFDLIDNTETCQLKRLGPAGAFTTLSGIKALRRSLSRSEVNALGGAALAANMLVWNLKGSDFAGGVKTGDRVVDSDSVEWVVIDAGFQTFGSRWRCTTKKVK